MELFKKYEVNQIKYGCSFIFGDKDNIIKNTEKENKQMTREEVIKYAKEQLDVFGGKHADFIKLAIELLEQDGNKKLLEIKRIIGEHDKDSMPEDYFYIDKIREVINK